MPASPIRKLMPLADEARRRGIHIYHLNIGQPDLETPEPMRRRLRELRDTVFAYTPSGGTPEYVATRPGVLPRGSGSPSAWKKSSPPPGAARPCCSPSWPARTRGTRRWSSSPSTRTIPRSRRWPGCAWCPSPATPRTGSTSPRGRQWEKALTKRTRMVLLCNPSNPTGTVYGPEELRMVADFCREHQPVPDRGRGLPRVRVRRPEGASPR